MQFWEALPPNSDSSEARNKEKPNTSISSSSRFGMNKSTKRGVFYYLNLSISDRNAFKAFNFWATTSLSLLVTSKEE